LHGTYFFLEQLQGANEIKMSKNDSDKHQPGLFMVDLRGLELSEEQLASIDQAIQDLVQLKLAEIDDLEGPSISPLGVRLMGLKVDI